MKIPLFLLRTFVRLDLSVEKLCETLTLLGIEVDAVINEKPPFAHVIVGEVLSTKPHPNGSRLVVAEVNDGKQTVAVVCGAENCRAGMKTAFAKVGALIADQNGAQRTIEKTTLRGVESHGMLCSASELLLWEDASGILELPADWPAGKDLAPLLWDPILELSLTPNLGHCLSALGIARELSAALQIPLHRPKIHSLENGESRIGDRIKATVHDFSCCPRYMCRLIEGVKIGPSPFWLQRELLLCGLKPIHNAVDVANYIMIKLGQPLHAFDYNRIEGSAVGIAPAKTAHTFIGLDGVERNIPPGTLLISDAKKPIALAGILGGENSAVNPGTTNILLEAACFDPISIRQGARKMGLRTESALRFEKGVDPNGVEEALDEAAHLIADVCHGKVAQGKIDLKKGPFPHKQIRCRPEKINGLLGTHFSHTEIEELFHRLGFKTEPLDNKALRVDVPPYRFDISEEIDLVEEAARLYGYNNIAKGLPRCINSRIPDDPVYLFEKEMRSRCVALGLQEFLTSDLIGPTLAALALEIANPDISLLKALQPKTEEYSILRPSLLPGLLQTAKENLDQKNQTFSAFEIGRIHFLQKGTSMEVPMTALLLTGKRGPAHWSAKPDDVDFYDLKGLLETLFEGLHIAPFTFQPSEHLSFHPGRQANIQCGHLIVGSLGEVHPNLTAKLDIKQRILYAELNLLHLMDHHRPRLQMAPLPQFPSSERDWTLSLPLSLPIETVLHSIRSVRPLLLEKIELLDLYQPESSSQKNATFRFTYRDPLKTVSHEEVEAAHAQLMERVSKLLAK